MAPHDLRERPMDSGDIPLLEELEQVCFPEDPWSATMFQSFLGSPVVRGTILEEGERVVGYMVAYEVMDEAELLNIAIVPDERGRGLGRGLLGRWLDGLRARGTAKVYLDVRESNTPAIELYRSFGFEQEGRRRRYYSNGEDALEMMVRLDRESTGKKRGQA